MTESPKFRTIEIPPYLVNEYYDDRYFDVFNALAEARHVFFEGNALGNRLPGSAVSGEEFRIGETGFGAGRNLLSLMNYLEEAGMTGLNISFNSVELHPISGPRMSSILAGFGAQAGPLIELLVGAYGTIDISQSGPHRIEFELGFGRLALNLWICEALDMVRALPVPCDAWFLDGHGPKKNPAIWRPELLHAIGEKTKRGGTCATYTVAGAVRRSLAEAGFVVEQHPGLGGKKSVLRAAKL